MNVYMCKKCSTVTNSSSTPNQHNCPRGGYHSWQDLGKSGGITFQCKKCGNTVKTYSTPSRHNCPSNGYHSWTKLGGENPKSENKTSQSTSRSSEDYNDVKFSDTLTGKAVSGAGKLAGKAWSAHKERKAEKRKQWEEENAIEEAEERAEKAKIKAKAEKILEIELSSDSNELESQVEQLLARTASLKTNDLPIRKAAYAKLELAIRKMTKNGIDVSYYEERMKKIKPTFWHSLSYWFQNG